MSSRKQRSQNCTCSWSPPLSLPPSLFLRPAPPPLPKSLSPVSLPLPPKLVLSPPKSVFQFFSLSPNVSQSVLLSPLVLSVSLPLSASLSSSLPVCLTLSPVCKSLSPSLSVILPISPSLLFSLTHPHPPQSFSFSPPTGIRA